MRILLTIALALIIGTTAAAQADTTQQHGRRPKVGLVLSGGGAKGMAHIGILKELESVGIYPDYITGTSMGSIIGALYSIGYTIDELENFARNTDWLKLMSNSIDQKRIAIDQKDDLGWHMTELSFENKKPVWSAGIIEGQNLSQFFSRLTWRTIGINDFDSYPIPFRCYGVDILKCRLIEFDSGNLAQAIRSSMAIPLVFSPVLIENDTDTMLIVDGGVMHNFPVDDARQMGADIIIGAYTGYEETVSAEDMNSLAKITGRVLMFGGVNDSRQQIEDVDYLIVPDMSGIQPADFLQADKILQRGEDAVRLHHNELKRLADSLNSIEPRQRPTTLVSHDSVFINRVCISGVTNTSKELLLEKLGISGNQWVTMPMIEHGIANLYATLLYKSINYQIDNNNGFLDLAIRVKEKGNVQFNFSPYYDDEYDLGFILKYSHRNLWTKKYQASVFANFNQYPGFMASLGRSINPGRTLITSVQFELYLDNKNIFQKNKLIGEMRFNHLRLDIAHLDYIMTLRTTIGAAFFAEAFTMKPDRTSAMQTLIQKQRYHSQGISLTIKHNSLNDNVYPTSGILSNLTVKGVANAKERFVGNQNAADSISHCNYIKINADYERSVSFAALTLTPSVSIGIATDNITDTDKNYIGGYKYNLRYGQNPFIGMRLNHICDNNFGNIGLSARYTIFKFANIVAKVNAVATYSSLSNFSIERTSCTDLGYGAGLLFKTPLGPCSVMIGNDTYIKQGYIYMSLGFNLPYIK